MKTIKLVVAFSLLGMVTTYAPQSFIPDASHSGLLLGIALLGLIGARRILRK